MFARVISTTTIIPLRTKDVLTLEFAGRPYEVEYEVKQGRLTAKLGHVVRSAALTMAPATLAYILFLEMMSAMIAADEASALAGREGASDKERTMRASGGNVSAARMRWS